MAENPPGSTIAQSPAGAISTLDALDFSGYILDMPKKITRAAALVKGLPRYFTGKLCKHGHVAERFVSNKTCVQCHAGRRWRYDQTPKGRASIRRRNQSPKHRDAMRRYFRSPAGRDAMRRYFRSPKGREAVWRYDHSPKGRASIRRRNQSPKGRDRDWRYQNSPKGRERSWQYKRRRAGDSTK
jgi:hypothetical protein